eukprot:13779298-Alexandrium_andersonii.AAC.1
MTGCAATKLRARERQGGVGARPPGLRRSGAPTPRPRACPVNARAALKAQRLRDSNRPRRCSAALC